MASTNNFKSAIIITGEVGASFRNALKGTAKETNLVGEEFKRMQKTVALVDRAIGYKVGTVRISEKSFEALKKTLREAGIDTEHLSTEQVRLRDELAKVEQRLKKIDGVKNSVGALGSAWKSLTKTIKSAGIAAGVFTGIGYGLFRFTRSIVDFNNSARIFRNFDYTVMRLKYSIAQALMPSVAAAINQLGQFFDENRKEIAEVAGALGDVFRALMPFAIGFLKVALGIGRALAAISRVMPDWLKATAVLVAGAGMAAVFVAKLWAVGAAVVGVAQSFAVLTGAASVFSSVLAATPIGWVVAIGAAVVGVSLLIYRHWAPIKAFFKKLFSDPKAVVMDLWRTLKGMFDWLKEQQSNVMIGALTAINPGLGIGAMINRRRDENSAKQDAGAAQPVRPRPVASAGRGASRGAGDVSQSISVTVNAAAGQSPEQIAQAAIRMLKREGQQIARLSSSTGYTPA